MAEKRILNKKKIHLFEHEDYIKKCCPLVSRVHCSSVYFDESQWYLSFPMNFCERAHRKMPEMVAQLNKLLGTNFELAEPEGDE